MQDLLMHIDYISFYLYVNIKLTISALASFAEKI